MGGLPDWAGIERWGLQLWETVLHQVLSVGMLAQAGALLGTWLVARLLRPSLRAGLDRLAEVPWVQARFTYLMQWVRRLLLPLVWLPLLWISVMALKDVGQPVHLLRSALSLMVAWIVIRFSTQFVKNPAWSKLIFFMAWGLAALGILNLLEPTIRLLDEMAFQVGNLRLSALLVFQGIFSLALFLWLAVVLSNLMETRIQAISVLTPSVQVLTSKLLKILLFSIAVVAALGIIGVDVTAFAVFTGAVGVGIGFGLQKVVSNLISGVILLLDRSVKPGDVISVGDTFGWINSLGARYVSVVTRDGREYLIPNEDLITQQVVNWSFSNEEVRLELPIGVSYRCDPHEAIKLCLKAARENPRVMSQPQAQCLLQGFGDSSVDLELRIWINDPQNGISNLKSDILLRVWDLFKENGIEIPFPQRDLHLVSPARLDVRIATGEDAPEPMPEKVGEDPEGNER